MPIRGGSIVPVSDSGQPASCCQTREGGGGSLKIETSVREKLAPLCGCGDTRQTDPRVGAGWLAAIADKAP